MYREPIFQTQVKSGLMTKMTRVDKQRVNEAVSQGLMPNLPATVSGRERLFSVPHLIALRIYAELTEQGVIKPTAGAVASRALQVLEADLHHEFPTLDWAVFFPHRADLVGEGAHQTVPFFANEGFKPNGKHNLGPRLNGDAPSKGSGFFVSYLNHRRYIMNKLQNAAFLLGVD